MIASMVLRVLTLSSLILFGAAMSQPPSESSSPFPPGQGHDALVKVCSGCHGAGPASPSSSGTRSG